MAAEALESVGWSLFTILALCAALRMVSEITNRPVCPNCKSGHTFQMDEYEKSGATLEGWACRNCYHTWEMKA